MRRVLILLPLAACGGASARELDGTWTSDRDATAQVTFDGETVTMSMKGLAPTAYRQRAERTASGYLLRWTTAEGEELRVDARLDGERLLLALDGQEFVLRRNAR